jgi:Rps23 Pro-64 3,4-dihydroxylase Tpa1-like proline 4-hydroxylase
MKIFNQALSDDLLLKLEAEVTNKLNANCWSVSHIVWDNYLVDGITGSVLISPVEENKELLREELQSILPKTKIFTPNFHVWMRGSGINTHADTNHVYGATLYLNPDWNFDWGGLFCWQNDDEIDIILPKHNVLVLNDEHEKHYVTPISNTCENMRITIQIWGDNDVPRS